MARTTKQLSGGGKDKFLRGLIGGEPSLPPAVRKALGDKMCAAISDVRVRREAWVPGKVSDEAAAVGSSTPPPAASVATPPPGFAGSSTEAPVFDPYAFSALAVLGKQGRAALAERLAGIASASNLHAVGRAQHLAVDAGLTDLAQLRAALLAATEARLAERRAAAS